MADKVYVCGIVAFSTKRRAINFAERNGKRNGNVVYEVDVNSREAGNPVYKGPLAPTPQLTICSTSISYEVSQ